MSRLARCGVVAAAGFLAGIGVASAALPPGISGSWYDPAKSGQGLSIDVLSRDRAIVSWAATDLDGHPFNLYTEAAIEGETMIGRALAPRGLRFGAWDRNDLEAPDWGEIRIDFSDCDNAVLHWTPDGVAGVGFPAGSMPLRRLTSLAGVRCDFGAPADPSVRVSTVRMKVSRYTDQWPLQGPYGDNWDVAAIDPEGRFWGVEASSPIFRDIPVFPHPSLEPFLPNARLPAVVTGGPLPASSGPVTLHLRELAPVPRRWLSPVNASGSVEILSDGVRGRLGDVTLGAADLAGVMFDSGSVVYQRAQLLESADRTLDFAGRYRVDLRTNTSAQEARIEVREDGRLCLRMLSESACEMVGELKLAFTGAPFVDFEIGNVTDPSERYSGRGWLQYRTLNTSQVELVLVGLGANNSGWGVAALRE